MLKPRARFVWNEYLLAERLPEEERAILSRIAELSGMTSFFELREGHLRRLLEQAGFTVLRFEDATGQTSPSLLRLRRYALIPYRILKLLGRHRNHPDLMAATECPRMVKKGLLRYGMITAAAESPPRSRSLQAAS